MKSNTLIHWPGSGLSFDILMTIERQEIPYLWWLKRGEGHVMVEHV